VVVQPPLRQDMFMQPRKGAVELTRELRLLQMCFRG
jgi:hypothetical protein